MIKDIQQEILRVKKEKGITILAHSYQAEEIQEIADYTGDSFRLSELAKTDKNDTVIMCGVRQNLRRGRDTNLCKFHL